MVSGLCVTSVLPQPHVETVSFNDAWDNGHSQGVSVHTSDDQNVMDIYKMTPIIVVEYQPQFWRTYGYGTYGYTGKVDEAFEIFTGHIETAGIFEPYGSALPSGS